MAPRESTAAQQALAPAERSGRALYTRPFAAQGSCSVAGGLCTFSMALITLLLALRGGLRQSGIRSAGLLSCHNNAATSPDTS